MYEDPGLTHSMTHTHNDTHTHTYIHAHAHIHTSKNLEVAGVAKNVSQMTLCGLCGAEGGAVTLAVECTCLGEWYLMAQHGSQTKRNLH